MVVMYTIDITGVSVNYIILVTSYLKASQLWGCATPLKGKHHIRIMFLAHNSSISSR